jgi:hypothetical protein
MSANAEELVASMIRRYATVGAYEDVGTLLNLMTPDDGSDAKTSRTAFETVFDRVTAAFRFDFTATQGDGLYSDRRVVWRGIDGKTHEWWSMGGLSEADDLESVLGAMAGVSGTTSVVVPRMLFGMVAGSESEVVYLLDGECDIAGVTCAKLVSDREGMRTILSIGTDGHVLRRLERRMHVTPQYSDEQLARMTGALPPSRRAQLMEKLRGVSPFVTETTIDYRPAFEGNIDGTRFDFVPPVKR